MGGKGFPPAPNALKLLRGNPGRRPINKEEPKPALGAVPLPAILDEEGRAQWEHLLPELERVGLATKVDGPGLTAVCLAISDYIAARKSGKWARRDKAFAQLMRILPEFGLTPSSRSRIKVDVPKAKSKVDEFRERHGG